MNRPWLLIAASGVVVGALFGWIGVVAYAGLVVIVAASARQAWVVVALVGTVAATIGVARVGLDSSPIVASDVLNSHEVEVVVAIHPQIGPSGPRAVVRVHQIEGPDATWMPADGQVLAFFGDSAPGEILPGDRLRLRWAVNGLEDLDPGFRQFVDASGAGAVAWVYHTSVVERGSGPNQALTRLRATITDSIRTAIGGDAGALLAGFVTGDDSHLSEAARTAFEQTNTSHITAVSGSNVAILLSLWYLMLPTRRLRRSIVATAVIMCAIWGYVILVGLGPGAVRAGLFATILLPAARAGRKPDPLTALALASAVMILANPDYAGNVGFWLSLSASAAMLTTLGAPTDLRSSVIKRGLLALFAAQVATLPITFWVFDGWSPASFVANLTIGPIVSAIFPLAFVTAVAVTVFPWVGGVIGWIPALGANLIITIVQSLAGEFPMLRPGGVRSAGVALLAIPCLATIALISVDTRRWLDRTASAWPGLRQFAVPIVLGASAGVWLGALLYAAVG